MRVAWDEENEKWWLSVVDVVAVLTDSDYQTARKEYELQAGKEVVSSLNALDLKKQNTEAIKANDE